MKNKVVPPRGKRNQRNPVAQARKVLDAYAWQHGDVAKWELIESVIGDCVLPLNTEHCNALIAAATSPKVVVFSTFSRLRNAAWKPN